MKTMYMLVVLVVRNIQHSARQNKHLRDYEVLKSTCHSLYYHLITTAHTLAPNDATVAKWQQLYLVYYGFMFCTVEGGIHTYMPSEL